MLGPGRINFHRSHYRMFLCLETPKPTPLSASSNTSALLRALREALAALTAPTDLGGIGIATRRSYKAQIVAGTVHPESAFFLLLIFGKEFDFAWRNVSWSCKVFPSLFPKKTLQEYLARVPWKCMVLWCFKWGCPSTGLTRVSHTYKSVLQVNVALGCLRGAVSKNSDYCTGASCKRLP